MIYIVLPIYNEENNIRKLIPEIRLLMKPREYQIIAMNDGSSDGTLRVLNELLDNDLKIVGTLINMNIGAVFSSAIDQVLSMASSDDDIMVMMEGDQTGDNHLIEKMVQRIEQTKDDVVIASRYQKGGGYRNFPLPRLIYSRSANFILRTLFPIRKDIVDYTIFMRAYRVGILRQVSNFFSPFGLIQTQGFIANSELLIKISLFTKRMGEVPFIYDYGRKIGQSKMNIIRTINEYFVFTNYMKGIISRIKSAD